MNELTGRLRNREGHDYAIAVGGLALFTASLLGAIRMEEDWAAFPIWLLLTVPCVILLALARRGDRQGPEQPLEPAVGEVTAVAPWRIALALAGFVLLGLSLGQLTIVLGDEAAGNMTATWVLLVVGLLAAGLAARADSRGGTLLACIALGGALIAFADWTGDGLGTNGVRDLLLALGIIFLLSARLTRATRIHHSHLFVAVGTVALLTGAVIGAVGEIDPYFFILPEGGGEAAEIGGDDGWELIIVAVSLGALAYAAREAARGPAYGGVGGLIAFVFIAAGGSLSGWPIVLAVVAAAGIAYGLAPRAGETGPPR